MFYFNPKTRPDFPKRIILGGEEVTPHSIWYASEKDTAYESREAAEILGDHDPLCWWENGKLFRGRLYSKSDFKPLLKEPEIDTIINWSDAYFLSIESAKAWLKDAVGQWDEPRYHDWLDVWTVHFHNGLAWEEPLDKQANPFKKMSLG